MASSETQDTASNRPAIEAYYRPILQILADAGGAANRSDVLRRVEERMRHVLTPADYTMIPSERDLRWRTRAKWASNHLKNDGLLQKGEPRGTWHITDAGRRYLAEHSK